MTADMNVLRSPDVTVSRATHIVERVARAICGAWVAEENTNGSIVTAWADLTEEYKPEFRAMARAALEASHHAEIVEALRACDVALRECGVGNMGFVSALLTKIGGEK